MSKWCHQYPINKLSEICTRTKYNKIYRGREKCKFFQPYLYAIWKWNPRISLSLFFLAQFCVSVSEDVTIRGLSTTRRLSQYYKYERKESAFQLEFELELVCICFSTLKSPIQLKTVRKRFVHIHQFWYAPKITSKWMIPPKPHYSLFLSRSVSTNSNRFIV